MVVVTVVIMFLHCMLFMIMVIVSMAIMVFLYIIFVIMIVVISIRHLRNRLYVFARFVLKKVLIGLKLKRHMLGEKSIFSIRFNFDFKNSTVF